MFKLGKYSIDQENFPLFLGILLICHIFKGWKENVSKTIHLNLNQNVPLPYTLTEIQVHVQNIALECFIEF